MRPFVQPRVCALVLCAGLLLAACVRTDKAPPQSLPEQVTGPLPPLSASLGDLADRISSALDDAGANASSQMAGGGEMKVALLVPLSGKSAEIGTHMLDAASLAVVDAGASRLQAATVVLVPKDTGTSATVAQAVAAEAIAQGARATIGPLFSQSVQEVAKVAAAHQVPVLALTNNRQVAQAGVTVFGFAPEDQIKRVSDYALSQGVTHMALLAPNDAYGSVIAAALKKSFADRGGVLTAVEMYGKRNTNIAAAVKRLAESYRLQPFKSLMVADTQANTVILLKTLKEQGVDVAGLALFGTALWEETSAPSPVLVGGIYATTDPRATTAFMRRFEAVYGYQPKRIAALAYDAVRLMGETGGRMEGNHLGMATGAYRIGSAGVTERSLAVLRLTPTGNEVITPALKSMRDVR